MPRPADALPAVFAELGPDAWTQPFWAAAREHRLAVPRCDNCQTFRYPPAPFCHACRHQDVTFADLPGTGTVYTFTVVRHAVVPELRDHLPYVVAVVTVDGAPGVRLIANLVESDPDAVTIGARVEVVWDDVNPDVTIPRFRLAA